MVEEAHTGAGKKKRRCVFSNAKNARENAIHRSGKRHSTRSIAKGTDKRANVDAYEIGHR